MRTTRVCVTIIDYLNDCLDYPDTPILTRGGTTKREKLTNERLGSIIAIDSSMDMLRIESTLVDQFVMEIVHHMIVCIRLCRHDDASLGVAEKAERVIHQLGEVRTLSYSPKRSR